MRISDWSSDVCSSDLQIRRVAVIEVPLAAVAMAKCSASALGRRVMRKWMGIAAGVGLALGVAGQAAAAQPSAKQVRQLFEVMHMDQMFGQMNAQMAGVMGQAVQCEIGSAHV